MNSAAVNIGVLFEMVIFGSFKPPITWYCDFFFFFVVLGLELKAYTLSDSTSPLCEGLFQDNVP
jgi:hypothetical protein